VESVLQFLAQRLLRSILCICALLLSFLFIYLNTGILPQIHWFSICSLLQPEKEFGNKRHKWFVSFKMCAKWEWAITWWNPAAQMRPVLDSSSFATILTLPCRT
jgi:hypothetical protein